MPAVHSALGLGQPAPALTLPTIQGETASLESLCGKQCPIIWFSRGYACPFCRQQTARLQLGYARLKELGEEILQIAPNPLPRAKSYFVHHKLHFPYLCDESLQTYRDCRVSDRGLLWALAFDLMRRLRGVFTQPLGYTESLWADWMGPDVLQRLQYHLTVAVEQGVFFIIDRRGIIRYAKVFGPVASIPNNEELIGELDKLRV